MEQEKEAEMESSEDAVSDVEASLESVEVFQLFSLLPKSFFLDTWSFLKAPCAKREDLCGKTGVKSLILSRKKKNTLKKTRCAQKKVKVEL